MHLSLTEKNFCSELDNLQQKDEISSFAASALIRIIHVGGKKGLPMSKSDFARLSGEVDEVMFTDTERRCCPVHRRKKAFLENVPL